MTRLNETEQLKKQNLPSKGVLSLPTMSSNSSNTGLDVKEMAMDSEEYLKTWFKIPSTHAANFAKSLDPEAYVKAYWNNKTRPDGRIFPQSRPAKVVSSLLKHSAGSALVKQGDTKVLAAATVQIGQPNPELPDHGDVIVNVTTPEQSHSDVLQSWLQRIMDGLIPPKLTLMTGKACIRLVLTVLILQEDGNLHDVALTACMAAWKDTRLPTMDDLIDHQGKLWWKDSPVTSLTMVHESKTEYRVSLTMGVLEKDGKAIFLVDPTGEESPYINGLLTVIVTLPRQLIQFEYSGSVALTATDMVFASKLAVGRADELSRIL